MRRLIVIFGIALMVFAFVILTIFIIAPSVVTMDDAPLLKSMMQIAVCRPNEVLTAKYSTYNTPTSTTRSTYLSCADNEQHARDVSQQIIGIGAIGYLGPFLIGLFSFLLAAQSTKKTSAGSPSMKSDLNLAAGYAAGQRISAADDRRARKEAMRKDRAKQVAVDGVSPLNPSMHGHPQTQDLSDPLPHHQPLAQRLQELKDAFNAGLMTEAEYTAKRQSLLNES